MLKTAFKIICQWKRLLRQKKKNQESLLEKLWANAKSSIRGMGNFRSKFKVSLVSGG